MNSVHFVDFVREPSAPPENDDIYADIEVLDMDEKIPRIYEMVYYVKIKENTVYIPGQFRYYKTYI